MNYLVLHKASHKEYKITFIHFSRVLCRHHLIIQLKSTVKFKPYNLTGWFNLTGCEVQPFVIKVQLKRAKDLPCELSMCIGRE